jgi:3-hydroxyacyl-CoA dehydrogenase
LPEIRSIRKIAVIGAGFMGHAIAQVYAQAGYLVAIFDVKKKVLGDALKKIRFNLHMLVKNEIVPSRLAEQTMERIEAKPSMAEAVSDADFVHESISEIMTLKREVISDVENLTLNKTIIATNSGTFKITDVALGMQRPGNFVGVHFFNPPYLIPAVEIIPGDKTNELTVRMARDLIKNVGKVPIICKDIPGKLINRIQMAMYNEAFKLLEMGVATPEDIDNAVRCSFALRLPFYGPFRIWDLTTNMKTGLLAFESLYKETNNSKFRPLEIMKQKVDAGALGATYGKGWYNYKNKEGERIKEEMFVKLTKFLKFLIELEKEE